MQSIDKQPWQRKVPFSSRKKNWREKDSSHNYENLSEKCIRTLQNQLPKTYFLPNDEWVQSYKKKINFISISLSLLVIQLSFSFPKHTHATTQKHTFFRVDFPSAFATLSFGVLTRGTHILSSMKLKLCSSSDIRACGKAFQTFGDAFSLICLMLTKLNHNGNHTHFLMARHLIEKLKKENALRCSFLIFFLISRGWVSFWGNKKN